MSSTDTLEARARRIGEDVAGPAAGEVDRDARFPAETFAAVREAGLLGALVPVEWGGPGMSITEMGEAVQALAEYCGSSALILAMHATQVACIFRHAGEATIDRVVSGLLSGELLLANGNSEVGLGGERRQSICALQPIDGGFRLEKQTATLSYGEYADGVLATARRSEDSPPSEQVMAVCLPPTLKLQPTGEWNTLGMRGTCSRPALLTAELTPELVIENYGDMFSRTLGPTGAVLLSAVWMGLAEAAARNAHATVRTEGRKLRAKSPDAPPPTKALRLAELAVILHQLREVLAGGAARWESAKDAPEGASVLFLNQMDYLTISASTLVIDIANRAQRICGLPGYQDDSPTSMGRIIRDASAAPLMLNNDRSLTGMAQIMMVRKGL